jgi:putative addiction module component (TIGR02574 family)
MNIEEIKKMSHEEQLALISEIWDNLDKDSIKIPASHIKEVRQRIERIKQGKVKFYSWEEIKLRLHNR